MNNEDIIPGKLIFTEKDFGIMNWHDVNIHGIGFDSNNFELLLDIDYIFKWIEPEPGKEFYSFLTAPATLVFRNVWDYNCDFTSNLHLTIMSINRSNQRIPNSHEFIDDKLEYTWVIELLEGEITFNSTGYTLYSRRLPERTDRQSYTLPERKGISFEKVILSV